MTNHIRLVAISTEQRIIETEHVDPRQALLDALGQIPLGFTVATVDLVPDTGKTTTSILDCSDRSQCRPQANSSHSRRPSARR